MNTPQNYWLGRFQQEGALWQMREISEPHVQTTKSGEHVSAYFNSDIITSQPHLLEAVALDVLVPSLEQVEEVPDWVVSNAPYGSFVAAACARAIGARSAYVEPGKDYSTTFNVEPSSNVLVVCDDIYSGGGLLKTIQSMENLGARVVEQVFTLTNLSGRNDLEGREIIAAATIPAGRRPAENCYMCAQGSEAIAPRENWQRLVIKM